ncbi:hypothetical protein BDN71DRAFT_1432459 [Pleurotus eryngii]|uniref:Uncharacterized protein n=1 Tax=Pleurotus eryngii TaxID=5323 RepID=A0A9P5ZW59_PLEER|nr:hypothetical protein BDN71DRAFT_1432459 [Pleurotus eryngii]
MRVVGRRGVFETTRYWQQEQGLRGKADTFGAGYDDRRGSGAGTWEVFSGESGVVGIASAATSRRQREGQGRGGSGRQREWGRGYREAGVRRKTRGRLGMGAKVGTVVTFLARFRVVTSRLVEIVFLWEVEAEA